MNTGTLNFEGQLGERSDFIIRISSGRIGPCQAAAAEAGHILGRLVCMAARPDRGGDLPASGVGNAFGSGVADAGRLGLRNVANAFRQVRSRRREKTSRPPGRLGRFGRQRRRFRWPSIWNRCPEHAGGAGLLCHLALAAAAPNCWSFPTVEAGRLAEVAYLFRRTGTAATNARRLRERSSIGITASTHHQAWAFRPTRHRR